LKVAQSGFGTNGTLDSGFYGKGCYFTSSLDYALKYCEVKSIKVILISLIIPGNVFPVSEAPFIDKVVNENSYYGKACVKGFHTHYTVGKNSFFFFFLFSFFFFSFLGFDFIDLNKPKKKKS